MDWSLLKARSSFTFIWISLLIFALSACSTTSFYKTKGNPEVVFKIKKAKKKPLQINSSADGSDSKNDPIKDLIAELEQGSMAAEKAKNSPEDKDEDEEDFSEVELSSLPKEPIIQAKTKPYVVFGRTYTPQTSLSEPFSQVGIASWYGPGFHGKLTASGETFDENQMTAAHPVLPIPSYARVTNTNNGKSIVVRINDRGPFHGNRIIDLSKAAAKALGFSNKGTTEVRVEKIIR